MRRLSKCYKKFLSCVLAVAITVMGGTFQGNITAQAEDADARYLTYAVGGSTWRLYDDGVVADQDGVMYQLKQDGSGEASVSGYLSGTALSTVIVIPDEIPWTYSVYDKHWTLNSGQPSGTLVGTVDESLDSSTVTEVGEAAFKNATAVQEIILSENIRTIGDYAFSGCSNLAKLSIPDSVVNFGTRIIDATSSCTIYCNAGSAAHQLAQSNNYNCNTDNVIGGSTASPSPSPEVPETPAATEEPVASQTPAATEEASATQTPAATEEPAATQTPAAAVTPETSQTPAATDEPAATQAPAATEETSATQTPAASETAPSTVTPPAAVSPSAVPTATPVSVATPTAGQTTAPAGTPQASENPGATVIPVGTASPDASPAVTDTPNSSSSNETTVLQDNIQYTVSGGSATLNISTDTSDTSIKIPANVKVNGVTYPVTQISNGAFKNNKNIKKVVMGKNVTTIGQGAFRGCTKLTSVTFPSNLKKLKKNCFNGCKNLKKVELSDSVTKIAKAAFKGCTSLKNMTIGSNTKSGALTIDGKQVRYGAGTVKIDIGAKVLANCTSLTSLVINRMVTRIGNSAFKGCTSLSDIIVRSLQLRKVEKGALTGVSNCKISVPTKKVKPYSVLFKNKGQGKKVVVAKI